MLTWPGSRSIANASPGEGGNRTRICNVQLQMGLTEASIHPVSGAIASRNSEVARGCTNEAANT
jgi:hypothetical protein